VAIDIFKAAAGRGFIEANPAELTLKPTSKKARKRLTLEQYGMILNAAPDWLRHAMRLALCTLQRRGDVTMMRFDQIRDGVLYLIQEKTKKHDAGYLRIEIGPTLAAIITDCRDDIASPYLVHRRPERHIKRAGCDHWTQVTPEMVSREFQSVRDALQEFQSMPENQRPTFHEIRALGIKLYKDKGEDPQALAGHSSGKMTKNYDSGHDEIRWMTVRTL
jgi:integrase